MKRSLPVIVRRAIRPLRLALPAACSLSLSLCLCLSTAPARAQQAPPVSPAPVVRMEYDAQGNVARLIQAPAVANLSTSTDYDRLNRATTLTDARGKPTRFLYDGRENLLQVTDPRNLVTQYPRSGLGEALGLISPDTGVASHTVDEAGNLKTRIDSRGVLASYSYDALNRLTSVIYSQGADSQVFSWGYDQTGAGFSNGIGRLTSTQFPGGASTYSYDPQGRLVGSTQTVTTGPTGTGSTGSAATLAVGYGYDAAGHLTSITYPSGRVLYIPHVSGQPTSLSLAPDAASPAMPLLTDLQFEPGPAGPGALRSWNWVLDSGTLSHTRVFDAYGRMVRHPLGGALRDIRYDAADRIASFTHLDAGTGTATAATRALDQAFGYDELGRLTSVTSSVGSWNYGYDDNGNRITVTTTAAAATTTSNASIDPNSNRLLALSNPGRSFDTDASGNIIKDTRGVGYVSSGYDLAGRLNGSKLILGDGTPYGTSSSYTYDATGLRVRKQSYVRSVRCGVTTNSGTGSGTDGGFFRCVTPVEVVYVYDPQGQLLGEYDGGGVPIREYIWLQGLPLVIVDGIVDGNVAALSVRGPKSPIPATAGVTPPSADVIIAVPPVTTTIYYVHTDHLGTPRVAIDTAGRQRWSWVAEPFGNSTPVENPLGLGAFRLNLRMPGQYFDEETGWVYNWNRYYDPSTGRYAQSDPIGLAGGLNTYAYVDGNPLSNSDPPGLWSTGGHNYFIDQLYLRLAPDLVRWIKDGSAYADSSRYQVPRYSYMHAMSSTALSKSDSMKKWCQFMREKYDSYNRNKSSKNPWMRDLAYFNLGMMLHAVMDSTSPAHRGFQKWTYEPATVRRHGDIPGTEEDVYHAIAYTDETVNLMKRALSGQLPGDCECN